MPNASATGHKKVVDAVNAPDLDAPFGRKPDGTPRKCPPRGPGRHPLDEETRRHRRQLSKAKWWHNNPSKPMEYRKRRAAKTDHHTSIKSEFRDDGDSWVYLRVVSPLMTAAYSEGPAEPPCRARSARAGQFDAFYSYIVDLDASPPLRMPVESKHIAITASEADDLAAIIDLRKLQYLLEITEFHRDFLLKELKAPRCAFVLEKKKDLARTKEGLRFLRAHIRWRKRHGYEKPVVHYAEAPSRAGQLRDSERA